jgi:hypothetical protein
MAAVMQRKMSKNIKIGSVLSMTSRNEVRLSLGHQAVGSRLTPLDDAANDGASGR